VPANLSDTVWVGVLAGGIGSRFWPVSTRERPKQLLPLGSDRPLIVDTVERARALVPDERIRVLAGEHLAGPFRSVLTDLPESSYWIEPRARGTAPVLAWAAWRLVRADPEAVMVSLHADHQIRPLEAFRESVATAVDIARREELLLSIGIVPDRIETGYGHIEPGEPLSTTGDAAAYRVCAFHEKPDARTAATYVDQGYLWNTGIFVWKASVLLEEIGRHAPEIARHLPLLERSEAAFFEEVPVSVVDRAVMERSHRVGTVAATFEWDDVGSWEALARTRHADEDGNVIVGSGTAVDASRNIVFAEGGDVVLFGTEDLVVVRTNQTTLVLPRSKAVDLKSLLARLEASRP
jgi:mannose-1-phosphate guanylyltransferase